MTSQINENTIETETIELLTNLGYEYKEAKSLQRKSDEWILQEEFLRSVYALNFAQNKRYDFLNEEQKENLIKEAYKKLTQLASDNNELLEQNKAFHNHLINGMSLSVFAGGEERSINLELIDFENVVLNEFLATRQFSFRQKATNRFDILLFINGLPLVVFELKNPLDINATLENAFNQIQTYKAESCALFVANELCVISDGFSAKVGSLSADFSRFLSWKMKSSLRGSEATEAIKNDNGLPRRANTARNDGDSKLELTNLINGLFNPSVLLDFIRFFITYENVKFLDKNGYAQSKIIKKIAAYHQYYAVNKAILSVQKAMSWGVAGESKKGGVVWHTQGSGKSLSMVFFAAKALDRLSNPTLVILTDRNDLDNQLFTTFSHSSELLRTTPKRVDSTQELKSVLKGIKGGIIFSTMQKFKDENERFETLSNREDIIVIADEAHRTQYGFEARLRGEKISYGYAQNVRDALPNATYIGFSGTPIEKDDANTRNVFGDYIDIYDMKQAVEDGATVPLYYESRLAKIHLSDEGKKLIENLDKNLKDKNNTNALKLSQIIGAKQRLQAVAKDILGHFNAKKQKLKGKAMIACMSRQIAVDLYKELIALEPSLHDTDCKKGRAKLIITASSDDGAELASFHTSKEEQKIIANRVKDINDELDFIIVCDMWLTGFDAPPLHTLYVDKPMSGHNLMQAIARVNRVCKDKSGGLIVDYIGIMASLQEALKFYTKDSQSEFIADKSELEQKMLEKYEVIKDMLFEFDYMQYFKESDINKLEIIQQIINKILSDEKEKRRFLDECTQLIKAYTLLLPNEKANELAKEITLFDMLKNRIKKSQQESKAPIDREQQSLIKQIIDNELKSEGIVDILDKSKLNTKDISILSNEFLEDMRAYKHKHIALETLRKLLNDELKARMQSELRTKSLFEKMTEILLNYQNKLINATKVIEELIELSKELIKQDKDKKELGLSEYEFAFYSVLVENKSVEEVMKKEKLLELSKAVFYEIKSKAGIDWYIRESIRAQLRIAVRKVLKEFGYPPDIIKITAENAIKQAELIAADLIA